MFDCNIIRNIERKLIKKPYIIKTTTMTTLKKTTTSIDKLNKEIAKCKEAEHKLQSAYKMNRDIMEKAPFGVYIVNDKGIIEFANSTMLEISGNKYEDFIGLNALGLPSYIKSGVSDKIKLGLKGKYFKMGPIEYTSYLGKKTTIANFHGIPMVEEGARKLIVIVEDVTESKRADKLKDEFISTVSHELRTPLSITKEGVSLVMDEVPGKINKKQKEILATARGNIDRLARIINELLDISRIESGKMTLERGLVNITSLINQIVSSLNSKIKEKGLKLKIIFAKDDIDVYADPDKIIQVFTNLVANAIRFTEKGYIKISVSEKEKDVECIISDTGIGIAKDDIPKMFDKFRQFGRVPGSGDRGTGLGLSIAKGIIEMHGGKIWVESKPEEGTKFIFTLPKYDPETLFRTFINNGIKNASKAGDKLSIALVSIADLDNIERDLSPEKIQSLLKDMENILKSSLHQGVDVVFSGHGEIIIIVNCDRGKIIQIRGRLEKVLDNYLQKVKLSVEIKLLLGYATYPDNGNNADELLKKARET